MNPSSFVAKLEAMLPKFNGKLYDGKLTTNEGAAAVNEAITFLKAQAAISEAMTWDQYLGFAAKDHTVAQGKTEETGHDSPDGTTMS